jgi:hypothetical protein
MTKEMFDKTPDATRKFVLLQHYLYLFFGRFQPAIFPLYAFLNRLILLFQKPMVVVIFEDEKFARTVYCSHNDSTNRSSKIHFGPNDFGDKTIARIFQAYLCDNKENLHDMTFSLFNTRFKIGFFEIKEPDCSDGDINFQSVTESDEDSSKILGELLHEDSVISWYNHAKLNIADSIKDVFKEWAAFDPRPATEPMVKIIDDMKGSDVFINNVLNAIRSSIVNRIMSDISRSPLVSYLPMISGDKLAYDNIFFLLKTPSPIRADAFHYTYRLMLSEQQKTDVKKHFSKGCCQWLNQDGGCSIKAIGRCILNDKSIDEFMELVEAPVDLGSKSFIDVAMSSGQLFFSPIPNDIFDRYADDEKSLEHQQALYCLLYNMIENIPDDLKCEDIKLKASVTPILVNGKVWMGIMSLTTNNNDMKSWMWNLSYYLGIVSRAINKQIIDNAKKCYLDEVYGLIFYMLTKKSEEDDVFIKRVNELLRILGMMFPYYVVSINESYAREASLVFCEHDYEIKNSGYFDQFLQSEKNICEDIDGEIKIALENAILQAKG